MLEPPELGPRLRDRRQAKGLTLEGLAAASGVSRSMLSQVERGEANPTFATLWNLTQALGLNLDDLVTTEPVVDDAPVVVLDRAATPRLDGGDGGAVLWLLAQPIGSATSSGTSSASPPVLASCHSPTPRARTSMPPCLTVPSR